MSRMSLSTPCPVPQTVADFPLADRFNEDTLTSQIEYTRAIHQEFHNARPRRRSGFHRKLDKQAAVTIFEDVVEDEELVVEQPRALAGKTLLGRPAQKMPVQRISKTVEKERTQTQPSTSVGQSSKRASILPDALVYESTMEERVEREDVSRKERLGIQDGLKKNPRRRTIFIPSEDTTIMTIHPGNNATERLNDTFLFGDFAAKPPVPTGFRHTERSPEQVKPARRPRMSLAVAPKRLPLQRVGTKQNNLPGVNVDGQNGGKENIAPNGIGLDRDENKISKPALQMAPGKISPLSSRSRLLAPTAASQARKSIMTRTAVPLAKSPTTMPSQRQPATKGELSYSIFRQELQYSSNPALAKPTVSVPHILGVGSRESKSDKMSPGAPGAMTGAHPRKRFSPPKDLAGDDARRAKLVRYPVLSEDVAQPELYEESWLSHQEVALTELINEIFDKSPAVPPNSMKRSKSDRERMLEIYHQPTVTSLHKRLQASLMYGALSRPGNSATAPDPAHDIGLRKRLLTLWMDNYDEEALRAAAEVVVGRQVNASPTHHLPGSLEASEGLLDPSKSRRALAGFLETFLVLVEDVPENDDGPSTGGADECRWRRMVLRSFMLTWLLDQAKLTDAFSGCLFRRHATKKSSVSVLHALAGSLTPFIGDITRALKCFDFQLGHVQDPLDEMVYRIENIAVDLRDGIFLTRLVEVLLFSAKRQPEERSGDATVTIQMPDATVLESALDGDGASRYPRVLSQHLKMPCLGRAQKLHNVQVALSALQGHTGPVENVWRNVAADDIVDGHREKTLSLLWPLTSNFGLVHLVDWKELVADVGRATNERPPSGAVESSQRQREDLLMGWAKAYSLRNGLHLTNLTTSFADGKAYGAILDAFAAYIPTSGRPARLGVTKGHEASLAARLSSLGCSSAFTKQLTTSLGSIPSKTTTVSNLAFLASRLLPLARRHNAALLIQRAWRRGRSRAIASRRIALMRLAYACAAVVERRQQLVRAATVLQRAWRIVVDARIRRLNSDAQAFQVLARGWMARRRAQKATMKGFVDDSGVLAARVMGGW